jgi:hypothetical protein
VKQTNPLFFKGSRESLLLLASFLIFLPLTQAVEPVAESFDDSVPMKVQIDKALNYTTAELEKLHTAAGLVETVLSSVEFRTEVLNYTYLNKKQFANNAGLTNEQIYRVLKAGAETYRKDMDSRLDLELSMYYKNNSVVGYTYANISRIYTNRKFYSSYKPSSVAVNMVHEWTHKLGFKHDSASTSKRPHSVPYAVGRITGNLAVKVAAGATLTPYMGPTGSTEEEEVSIKRDWNPIPILPIQIIQ